VWGVLLGLCLLFFGQVPFLHADDKTVTLGIHHNPPFTFYENGQYKGFIVDIIREYCRQNQFKLIFSQGSFNDALEALYTGQVDVLAPLAYSAERAQKIRYIGDPVRIDAGNLVLPLDSLLKDYSDLNRRRIGGVKGDLTFAIMIEDFKKNNIDAIFVEYPSFTEIADDVLSGKLDTGLILTSSYLELQRDEKYRKKLKIMPAVMYTLPSYIGIHPSRLDIYESLTLFLKQQKGDLDSATSRSMDYWFSQIYTRGKGILTLKTFIIGGLSVIVILFMFFIFNIVLRRQVKLATHEIERQKSYFLNLIKLMPAGIIIMSEDNHIIDVNSEFLSLFQFSEEEVLGQDIDLIIIPKEQMEQARIMTQKVSAGQRIVAETQRLRKDGTLIHVGIVAEAIYFEGKKSDTIAIYIDRSEKMRFEEEMLKTKSIEAIGILAGGIAHDFNNMLTGIMGNISLAQRLTSDDKINSILNRAEKAAQNAAGLTKQLLTFSKGGNPIKEPASIAKVLKDSIDLVLSGSAIKPVMELEANLPLVEMDLTQMTQVFTNILLNAKQAMEGSGKVTIKAHCFFQQTSNPFLQQGEYLKVTISDEGKGINQENLEKIFTPFFTTKAKGTGLGLSVCYSVIKKHLGNIDVQSIPGKGSTFNIYLPTSLKPIATPSHISPTLIKRQKVLLMDDEEMIRDIFTCMLEEVDCEVTATADSLQAINAVISKPHFFDVAFLDLTIPDDIGGVETLKKIHEIEPWLYAVAISGYSESKVFSNPQSYGFQDILPKPFTLEQLIIRLNTRINQEKKV